MRLDPVSTFVFYIGAITIVLAFILKKLDEHWQSEAESLPVVTPAVRADHPACWQVKGCTEEVKGICVAYAHPETPCWQIFRADDGQLSEKCVGCEVFMLPQVPAKATVRVRA